jgi:hypothetical protein
MSTTYSECVSVTLGTYPVCNAHARYCHLWPVRLYNIFLLYPTMGTIFEKVIQHKMRVLIVLCNFSAATFRILVRTERDISINV